MKFSKWTWTTAATISLFTALTMPVSMAAQDDEGQHYKPRHHTYKLIDLGTFGGPNSYISTYPLGSLLSNSGKVVGFADLPILEPSSPSVNPDAYVGVTFAWERGVLTNLGTLPGGLNSYATGSNGSGTVVGSSENGTIDPLTGYPEYDAVIWRDHRVINLGTFGGNVGFAQAINDGGQIVGAASNTTPDPFAFDFGFNFIFTPGATEFHAALWQRGTMRDLGTLGGPDSVAWSINEHGQIVGQSFTSSTPTPTTNWPPLDPFLWENGRMIDLGTLGGAYGTARALNNRGQVAGSMDLDGDLTEHAFLWDRGSLKDLGTLGGDNSEGLFVNEAGEVVGRADIASSETHHAFLWKNRTMTDLGTIAGWPCSTAIDINARSQIIANTGICGVGGGPGSLWENGGPMVDLNSLILPASNVVVQDVGSINDQGEIAAYGELPNGDVHAVLLVPDGDCNHECETKIEESQNTATTAAQAEPTVGTAFRRSGTEGAPINSPRNCFAPRYHIPAGAPCH